MRRGKYVVYAVCFPANVRYIGITTNFETRCMLDAADADRDIPWTPLGERLRRTITCGDVATHERLESFSSLKDAIEYHADAIATQLATTNDAHLQSWYREMLPGYSTWDDSRDVSDAPQDTTYPPFDKSMCRSRYVGTPEANYELRWRVMWRRRDYYACSEPGDVFDVGETYVDTVYRTFEKLMMSRAERNCVSTTFAYDRSARCIVVATRDGLCDVQTRDFVSDAVAFVKRAVEDVAKQILAGATCANPDFDRYHMTRKAYEYLRSIHVDDGSGPATRNRRLHKQLVSELADGIKNNHAVNYNTLCSFFPKSHERRPKKPTLSSSTSTYELGMIPKAFSDLALSKRKLKAASVVEVDDNDA